MRKVTSHVTLAVSIGVTSVALTLGSRAAERPDWAYPVNPPSAMVIQDDGGLQHVPNSTAAFTRKQFTTIADPIPDWHREEHPAMPDIVFKGRPPQVYSCGYCHLPTGAGRPENASIAGLSIAYFKQQMLAFRNGERPGSEAKRAPQTTMIAMAKAATDAEIDEAAAYFTTVKPVSYVTVLESDIVPKTIVAGWTLKRAPDGGTEPLGQRIIEMPEDFERFERRDSRTPYVAYVPLGSVKRGAEFVVTGGGDKARQCTVCHGPELRGLADVPRLAGRSPSYLMRQLYDIKNGLRTGGASALMKPVVVNLSDDEMISIVAYLSSLTP